MRRSRLLAPCWTLLSGTILTVGISTAQESFPCPPMPDIAQVNHDVSVAVNAGVSSLGKIGAGEIGVKADVIAKNVFEKYPNADRVFTVQMIAATYCPMLRDSKDLKDSEKRRLWTVFYKEVLKFENQSYNPAPPPALKPKGSAPSTDKGKHPPAETQPFISQQCAPGASCAQSYGQQGGVTAGTYNGDKPPDCSVRRLLQNIPTPEGRFRTTFAVNLTAAHAINLRLSVTGNFVVDMGWVMDPSLKIDQGILQDIGPNGETIPNVPSGNHMATVYSSAPDNVAMTCREL